MSILFLDFESYYDDEYSLKKMAPPNYILDPRWETIGCAVRAEGDAESAFVDGRDFRTYLAQFDPANTTTVTFNALFDNCVLAWRYGFVPVRMLCAMRMAVALRGHVLPSASLASVGKCLGVGVKGTTILSAKGKHRADLMADPNLWREYQAYAINDNEMQRDIFYQLIGEFPHSERRIMDRVLRCAVVPKFTVNQQLLTGHLADLHEQKAQMLIDAGAPATMAEPERDAKLAVFAKTLRSNVKFKAVLEAKGIDIEYKDSVTNPEIKVPAFAKTDDFMAMLQEHDDPDIQALAAARLGLRSTIEQTRGARLLSCAELAWPSYCNGNMPMPLRYSAAHTHRLGGDWKYNVQNLPSSRKVGSKLRKALGVKQGEKVVVADKSQIECRINGWLCGQKDLLETFRNKGDPYSDLARAIFNLTTVDKKSLERFIGKSGVLGLGFGCGADKFYNMVIRSARTLGMDMGPLMAVWTPQLAQRAVRLYRELNGAIRATWYLLDSIISTAWVGNTAPVMFGPCLIGKGTVEGPTGLVMRYGEPRRDSDGEYWFTYGREKHKLYGAKFLENIVQFLARIDTMCDALRISDRGYPFCLQSHDELVFIVPEAEAQTCLDIAIEEMRRAPSWAKDIPLDAEGNFGDCYGDAK